MVTAPLAIELVSVAISILPEEPLELLPDVARMLPPVDISLKPAPMLMLPPTACPCDTIIVISPLRPAEESPLLI